MVGNGWWTTLVAGFGMPENGKVVTHTVPEAVGFCRGKSLQGKNTFYVGISVLVFTQQFPQFSLRVGELGGVGESDPVASYCTQGLADSDRDFTLISC